MIRGIFVSLHAKTWRLGRLVLQYFPDSTVGTFFHRAPNGFLLGIGRFGFVAFWDRR